MEASALGGREAAPQRFMAQWMALGDVIHTLLNSAEFYHMSTKNTLSRRDFFSNMADGVHGAALAALFSDQLRGRTR